MALKSFHSTDDLSDILFCQSHDFPNCVVTFYSYDKKSKFVVLTRAAWTGRLKLHPVGVFVDQSL